VQCPSPISVCRFGTLLATLKEQTRASPADNLEDISAEEPAVVAFRRLQSGELAAKAA